MKKLFYISLIISANTFLLSGLSHNNIYAQSENSKAVNVGNKICPVTGDKVDGKTTYEYQGKVYNFCCPACIPEFKKDPEKYIKKVEEELKGKQQTSPQTKDAGEQKSCH